MKRATILFIVANLLLWTAILLVRRHEPLLFASEAEITAEQERNLRKLAAISLQDAFEELKKPEISASETVLDRGVSLAFAGNDEKAIAMAMNTLRSPRIQIADKKFVNRSDDFRIAKKIFQQFPDEAVKKLEEEYKKADPGLKGNIIQVLGGLSDEGKVKPILMKALNNDSFCEEEHPEMEGIPLRVCDAAYNQLVLRYRIKDVLRTISTIHRIDTRDYHISILKERLASMPEKNPNEN